MNERMIETAVGRLAAYELGAAASPTAFLWPSLYTDHESLMPIARDLATKHRCILVDPPGHGRSAVPRQRYTLQDCATAAIQVLDAFGITEPVDWIGNAWGGHVGVVAALTVPSRLRSLTAIGSPMKALPDDIRKKTKMGLVLLALGARDLVGKLVAKVMVSPASPASVHDYVRACMRNAPKGGIALAVNSVSLPRKDMVEKLPRITVPTLFVAGADDPMWPPQVARAEATRIPGGRCETVPASAHLAPLERPQETLAIVSAFIARPSSTSTATPARPTA